MNKTGKKPKHNISTILFLCPILTPPQIQSQEVFLLHDMLLLILIYTDCIKPETTYQS